MDQDLLQIPNLLVIARFFLAVPLVLLIYLEGLSPNEFWNFLALVFFLVAVFTDKLDGYLARKYNQTSDFGKIMDPLADKIILISSMIMLTSIGIVPGLITAIIFGRALIVTGIRGFAQSEGIVIPASKIGKLKTFTQVAAVTLLLLGETPYMTMKIGMYTLYLATALTVYSGARYLFSYFSQREVER